jgi:hypothetical protein
MRPLPFRRQVNAVLEEACAQLTRESWRLPLLHEADDSPQLLLGSGGRLLDILVGSEFNEIVIRSAADSREEFLQFAEVDRLPGYTDRFDVRKSGFTVLQFTSAEAAQAALRSLKEKASLYSISDRDIGPWRIIHGGNSQAAAFELRVNVERRQNQAMAFIRFRTEEEAAAAARILSGTRLFVKTEALGGLEEVSVQLNKRDDKKSLFCWLQDRGSTRIKAVTEHRLLEAVKGRGLDPERVSIPKERMYESTAEEQENAKQAIGKVLTDSRVCSPADFGIEMKRPLAKDFTWVAWIRFQSSAAGLRCARYCEVGQSLT